MRIPFHFRHAPSPRGTLGRAAAVRRHRQPRDHRVAASALLPADKGSQAAASGNTRRHEGRWLAGPAPETCSSPIAGLEHTAITAPRTTLLVSALSRCARRGVVTLVSAGEQVRRVRRRSQWCRGPRETRVRDHSINDISSNVVVIRPSACARGAGGAEDLRARCDDSL